ncbi:cytochrome o ubiquinol oxidase subunit IV [Halomonadaceae bacterium KBTZ08]
MSESSQDSHSHGSVRSYVLGLVLSIILTVIPFGLVMSGGLNETLVMIVISAAAALQVLLQLVLFMHLNLKTEEGRDSGAFIFFTTVILVLVVGGSLWIMYHLDLNLM